MKNIATALINAQLELANPEKNQHGYGYKYADLSSIIDLVKPILSKHKLAITQLAMDDGNGRVGVETILLHDSGETITSKLTLPIPEMKGTTATQAAGAAITYARRYAISAILNINADEDTDAQGISKGDAPVRNTTPTTHANNTTVIEHDQPGSKLCTVHNVEMRPGKSIKTGKWYWSHYDRELGTCFGTEYMKRQ